MIYDVYITVHYSVNADNEEDAIDRAYEYLDSDPNNRAMFKDVIEHGANAVCGE